MHTRDEIMQMDAAQLRLAIAEVKGCGDFYVTYDLDGPLGKLNAKVIIDIQNWPKNISAAWELVEEMIANDRKFHLLRFGYLPSGSPKKHEQKITWEVCYGEQDVNLLEYARGDTAPLAIARAWLTWKVGAK